jgi:hypothetical protein
MKIKFYTVYQTTNLINNKIYIGRHVTTNLDDGYLGSGKHLKIDIKELGKINFKKEILFIFDNPRDMYDKEIELVNDDFRKRCDTYNLALGSDSWGMLGIKLEPRSQEYRDKMSKCKKGKKLPPHRPEVREKIIKFLKPGGNKGMFHTPEQKAKWSIDRRGAGNGMFGKKHTAESIEKNRQSNLGKKLSDETKRKMSESQKGSKRSPRTPEHTEKLRQANIGKKHPHSAEHKEKLRIAALNRWHNHRLKNNEPPPNHLK